MYKRQKQHLLNLFAASHCEKKSEKSSTYDRQTLLCLHFDWSRHPSCVVQLNVNSGTRNSRFAQDFSSHYHRRRHSTFLVLNVPNTGLHHYNHIWDSLWAFAAFSLRSIISLTLPSDAVTLAVFAPSPSFPQDVPCLVHVSAKLSTEFLSVTVPGG